MVAVTPPPHPFLQGGSSAERSRDQRRSAVMRSRHLTGLDYVRVFPRQEAAEAGGSAWRLELHFVPAPPILDKQAVPAGLDPSDLRFTVDGKVDRGVRVERLERGAEPNVVTAYVHSDDPARPPGAAPPVYQLSLERSEMLALDPLFTSAMVALDPGAATPWSLPPLSGSEAPEEAVPTDRLAKDYDSFRRMLLERMSFFIPTWAERNPSDLGVTVVEVLAYAADYLSYKQDAVATEAYLDTARRRVSVRRHGRLLDFHLAEGANARAWVQIQVAPTPGGGDGRQAELPAGTELLTSAAREPGVIAPASENYERAVAGGSLSFQTLHDVTLHATLDSLEIHTWGAEDFELAAGSTSAALVGWWPGLAEGDVLVFEKRQGYRETAPVAPDAAVGTVEVVVSDPRERHAVRLAAPPERRHDPLAQVDLTLLTWHADDALPLTFPVARAEGAVRHRGLTRARGNIVLADHGRRHQEMLPRVPAAGAYHPRLQRTGLTFHLPYRWTEEAWPASWALAPQNWDPNGYASDSRPDIVLYEIPAHLEMRDAEEAWSWVETYATLWQPRLDLLGSGRFARHFVVEVDEEGWPHLRFGDGANGRRPTPGSRFLARYRVGLGPQGNVGPHSIRHLVLGDEERLRLSLAGVEVRGVLNHLPAAGGCEPTAMDYARIYAPDRIHTEAFQERLVTAEDSAALALRHPGVADAAARHVWTGSSHTVELYVLPSAGHEATPDLEAQLARFLRPRLLLGWGLAVRPPRWVPLDIAVSVWLDPGERASQVFQRLSHGPGLLPAAVFRFGQSVYSSQVISRILAVPGVSDARLEVFQRWGQAPAGELENGVIPVGPLQVARLDNDPEAPQRGLLRVRFHYGDAGGAS